MTDTIYITQPQPKSATYPLLLAAIFGLVWLWRRAAVLNELQNPITLDADTLYELCPECEGDGMGCRHCWDQGLIEHHHD